MVFPIENGDIPASHVSLLEGMERRNWDDEKSVIFLLVNDCCLSKNW